MKPQATALKAGLISGIKALAIALLLSYGVMFVIQRTLLLAPLIEQVRSLNSHGVVQLDVIPNAVDLLGLSLQLPYGISSSSVSKNAGIDGINMQLRLHLLWLLVIPISAVYVSSKKAFQTIVNLRSSITFILGQAFSFTCLAMGMMSFNDKSIQFLDLPNTGLKIIGNFKPLEGYMLCFGLVVLIQTGLFYCT